jgi:hypothetical protein
MHFCLTSSREARDALGVMRGAAFHGDPPRRRDSPVSPLQTRRRGLSANLTIYSGIFVQSRSYGSYGDSAFN